MTTSFVRGGIRDGACEGRMGVRGARDEVAAASAETQGSAAWEPEPSCDLRCHVGNQTESGSLPRTALASAPRVPGARPALRTVRCARRFSEICAQF